MEVRKTDDLVEVANVDELDNGNMMMFNIDDREILIARVGDNYYSADNRCPHMGGAIYPVENLMGLLLYVQDTIVNLILPTAM